MGEPEPQPAAPLPHPPFQFGLRTLLLLFVVLGSSLAVFGAWGIVVFALVVGLAVYVAQAKTFRLRPLQLLVLLPFIIIAIDTFGVFLGRLLPAIAAARQQGWWTCWPNISALAVWLLSVGALMTIAVRSRTPQAVPPITPAG
jgi:hypothetical protein